jgi:DNA-binding NarL/FixJ family response regulator
VVDDTAVMRVIVSRILRAFFRDKPDIVLNLLKLGAKGYVTKPFTPEKLLNAVSAALAA